MRSTSRSPATTTRRAGAGVRRMSPSASSVTMPCGIAGAVESASVTMAMPPEASSRSPTGCAAPLRSAAARASDSASGVSWRRIASRRRRERAAAPVGSEPTASCAATGAEQPAHAVLAGSPPRPLAICGAPAASVCPLPRSIRRARRSRLPAAAPAAARRRRLGRDRRDGAISRGRVPDFAAGAPVPRRA